MGGTSSQELNHTTPSKDARNRKLLSIDPRSPSADIARTPILVDKTPEGALDPMLDPRSPTAGIYRTPLATLAAEKKDSIIQEEVSAASDAHHGSPVFPEVSPGEGSDVSMEKEETDPATVMGLLNLSLDEPPMSESTRLIDFIPGNAVAETEKRPKKAMKIPQPKELFPTKKGLAMKDKNTRSPLTMRTVDINSPLQIIQRKQTNKVDKARISSSESPNARFIVKDKENM